MNTDLHLAATAGSKRGHPGSPIRLVLFGADGVRHEWPGGWHAAAAAYLGERTDEFLSRVWDEELTTLAGLRAARRCVRPSIGR